MSAHIHVILLVMCSLLLLATLSFGQVCNPDFVEQLRRGFEGGIDTPEEVATVEATIAAMEENLGGFVRSSLIQRMAFYDVPGITIAVIREGLVKWVQAYGIGNLETGAPMCREMQLQAASITDNSMIYMGL